MIVVGIDPGLKGGLAAIEANSQGADRVETLEMPVCGGEVDGAALTFWLLSQRPDKVVLEKVHSMPKQGVVSTFHFGMGYGIVRGVLEAIGVPHRLVTPQAWKKQILAGTDKGKAAALNFVRRAYPQVDLYPGRRRTAHDGIADAVCLMEYGVRLG